MTDESEKTAGGGACAEAGVFAGMSPDYRRRLKLVVAINAVMFAVEMAAGFLGDSQALRADALDFLADTATYGMSLAVIGAPLRVRSIAAMIKGASLGIVAAVILSTTVFRVFVTGAPDSAIMGGMAGIALAANLASVLILMRHRRGDANVRSVWLCSRNDAIGNVAVMLAALGVWGTGTQWPDLAVAAVVCVIFLVSAGKIVAQARREYRVSARAGA